MQMGSPGDVPDETLSSTHAGPDLFSIRYVLVPLASDLAARLRTEPERWTAVEDLR
jgi:hypothetical protein